MDLTPESHVPLINSLGLMNALASILEQPFFQHSFIVSYGISLHHLRMIAVWNVVQAKVGLSN